LSETGPEAVSERAARAVAAAVGARSVGAAWTPRLDARGFSFGVVVSVFHSGLAAELLGGAIRRFEELGADQGAIRVVTVPGAFELPLGARLLIRSGAVDVVVCLGAVIRGETDHYDHVAREAAAGVARVALEEGRPVIFGVITAEDFDQAVERASRSGQDKGGEAAAGAVAMAELARFLGGK
jgi:6,7-dimethyl-8-ribityllumazine synthase